MMPGFLDSEIAKLPPIPDSNEPADIASFVSRHQIAHNRALMSHMDRQFEALRKELLSGFPSEDPITTRQLLETILDKERNKARFWRNMEERLATNGVWGLMLAIGAVMWWAFTRWAGGDQ